MYLDLKTVRSEYRYITLFQLFRQKMAKIYTLFLTKTAKKILHPLGSHILIWLLFIWGSTPHRISFSHSEKIIRGS